jgi:hypothetical protein
MSDDAWTMPQRSMRNLMEEIVGDPDTESAPRPRQDVDASAGVETPAAGSSAPWDDLADQAHDDGQSVLDALARRARRIGRRLRRTRNAPIRILRLMD